MFWAMASLWSLVMCASVGSGVLLWLQISLHLHQAALLNVEALRPPQHHCASSFRKMSQVHVQTDLQQLVSLCKLPLTLPNPASTGAWKCKQGRQQVLVVLEPDLSSTHVF